MVWVRSAGVCGCWLAGLRAEWARSWAVRRGRGLGGFLWRVAALCCAFAFLALLPCVCFGLVPVPVCHGLLAWWSRRRVFLSCFALALLAGSLALVVFWPCFFPRFSPRFLGFLSCSIWGGVKWSFRLSFVSLIFLVAVMSAEEQNAAISQFESTLSAILEKKDVRRDVLATSARLEGSRATTLDSAPKERTKSKQ